MYEKRKLTPANYKPQKGQRSYYVILPKEWVRNHYLDKKDEIRSGRKYEFLEKDVTWPWVYVGTAGCSISVLPADIEEPTISTSKIVDVKESLDFLRLDKGSSSMKAEALSSIILGAFVNGYDGVEFKNYKGHEKIVEDATKPFSKGFGVTKGKLDVEFIDFKEADNIVKYSSVKDLYGVIIDLLKQINNITQVAFNNYFVRGSLEELEECKKQLTEKYDMQVELFMWSVIRKICRDFSFVEKNREELAHSAYFIVLAADSKLLERYKDNYIEIVDSFLKFKLPSARCTEIMEIMKQTLHQLEKTVELLLTAAYVRSPGLSEGEYKETLAIISECQSITDCIGSLESGLMNGFLKMESSISISHTFHHTFSPNLTEAALCHILLECLDDLAFQRFMFVRMFADIMTVAFLSLYSESKISTGSTLPKLVHFFVLLCNPCHDPLTYFRILPHLFDHLS